jgi:hypothetical protein
LDRKLVVGICPDSQSAEVGEIGIGHFLVQIDGVDVGKIGANDLRRILASKPPNSDMSLVLRTHGGSEAQYNVRLKANNRRQSVDDSTKAFACARILKHHFSTKAVSDRLDAVLQFARQTTPGDNSSAASAQQQDDEWAPSEHVVRLVVAMRHAMVHVWRSVLLRQRILVCAGSPSEVPLPVLTPPVSQSELTEAA